MTQEKGEQRYFPTQEELAILVPKLKEYFRLPERSNERKAIVTQAFELVKDLNPSHWSAPKIRLWFNNNKNVYSGENQRRIPPPLVNKSDSNASKEDETTYAITPPQPTPPTTPPQPPHSFVPPPPPPLVEINTEAPAIMNITNVTVSKPLFVQQPVNLPSNDTSNIEKITDSTFNFSSISPTNSTAQSISFPSDSKFSFGSPSNSSSFNPIDLMHSFDSDQSQQSSIELPDVPDRSGDYDQQKHDLYASLNSMYCAIRNMGKLKPTERLENQNKAEERMTQILKIFQDLQIDDICSSDGNCNRIKTASLNLPGRQYSIATSKYASDIRPPASEIKYEETSPNVFITSSCKNKFKPKASISQNLSYILRGECQIENCKPKYPIECATISGFGDIAYVYLDEIKHAFMLSFKGIEVPTGFFTSPSSIYIDDMDSFIYVAGDCRVKSFRMTDLTPNETFYTSNTTLLSSCLTVSHAEKTELILGTKGIIAMWDVSATKHHNSSTLKNAQNLGKAKSHNLDLELIDWSRGRSSDGVYKPENCIEEVTSLCQFGDLIAFASKKHHSIHLLDKNRKELAGKLIGHVRGITRLFRLDSKTLLTGSKDHTCKIWDIDKMIAEFQLIRHSEKVTSMAAGTYENNLLIFTGGKDSIILGWNFTKKFGTFEIRLNGLIPIEMGFVPNDRKLIVVTKSDIMFYTFKGE